MLREFFLSASTRFYNKAGISVPIADSEENRMPHFVSFCVVDGGRFSLELEYPNIQKSII